MAKLPDTMAVASLLGAGSLRPEIAAELRLGGGRVTGSAARVEVWLGERMVGHIEWTMEWLQGSMTVTSKVFVEPWAAQPTEFITLTLSTPREGDDG